MREKVDWCVGTAAGARAAPIGVRALAPGEENAAARRAALADFVAERLGARPRIDAEPGGALLALGLAPAPFVSLGHRSGGLALAVADRPVGVDIEPLARPQAPAWRILHADERAALEALDEGERHRRFLAIWTAKEAYLKALRTGLTREPASIAVAHVADGGFVVADPRQRAGGHGETRLVRLETGDFLVSVALLD